jgi:hypothetical protein
MIGMIQFGGRDLDTEINAAKFIDKRQYRATSNPISIQGGGTLWGLTKTIMVGL